MGNAKIMQAACIVKRWMKMCSIFAKVRKLEVHLAGFVAVGVIGELPGTCMAFVRGVHFAAKKHLDRNLSLLAPPHSSLNAAHQQHRPTPTTPRGMVTRECTADFLPTRMQDAAGRHTQY